MSGEGLQRGGGDLDGRPDPDALLAKVEAEEQSRAKGQLKIFFGYSAGVGKTFAMLAAARAQSLKHGDVLIGYVEPHGRPDTEALLAGLPALPPKRLSYRGIELKEFDLEEALRRRPRLILVDELAHTNAEGCRHAKRWQDVLELLDAGVDVHTTVNVQHLESLNDVVARITGVAVRETVPDSVFDRASEVEVVDLPPAELLERFREGKVYVPEQARLAAERYFRKESLVALRELALRRTAEHVNRQVELGRRGLPSRPIWATRERLMVAIGPSPTSARLIRATRRMAAQLRAPWYGVAVEPTAAAHWPPSRRASLDANLRLAESLGAETATLYGDRLAESLIEFARARGVTRLVVGKPDEPRWRRWLGVSVVDRVIRASGDVDVWVIRGDPEQPAESEAPTTRTLPAERAVAAGTAALGVGSAFLLTLGASLLLSHYGLSESNIIMLFLLAIVTVAYTAGRVASSVLAVISVLGFNFFFTEPRYTFRVYDPQYILTFVVMLTVGLVVGGLIARVRAQADASSVRADANEVLHRFSSRLARTSGPQQIGVETLSLLEELLGLQAVIYGRGPETPGPGIGDGKLLEDPDERAVAAWVITRGSEAGDGTATLPDAAAWYLPLALREGGTLGALGVRSPHGTLGRARRQLVESVAALVTQALEREELAARAGKSAVEAESERLRSDLLATVSHDLRTPLAAIGGAAAAVLASPGSALAAEDRRLLGDVAEESERMTRLVEDLLQLGRLDEGRAAVTAEWIPCDEIVAAALRQLGRLAPAERVQVDLPRAPWFVLGDPTLLTQLLVNLLGNALQHAPDSAVELRAGPAGSASRIVVADRGPGLGEDPARLFRRFERGGAASGRGVGLGLAICRAIALAHGGTIEARNREGGGAEFTVLLPVPAGAAPPALGAETDAQ